MGRVVDPRDGLLDIEMLLCHLQGDEIVLVVGGDGDDRVSALDTRLRKELHLASISSHDDAPELSLQPVGPPRLSFDEGHLVSALEKIPRHVIADRATADNDHIHLVRFQQGLLDVLRALDGRTDRVEAKLLVRSEDARPRIRSGLRWTMRFVWRAKM